MNVNKTSHRDSSFKKNIVTNEFKLSVEKVTKGDTPYKTTKLPSAAKPRP